MLQAECVVGGLRRFSHLPIKKLVSGGRSLVEQSNQYFVYNFLLILKAVSTIAMPTDKVMPPDNGNEANSISPPYTTNTINPARPTAVKMRPTVARAVFMVLAGGAKDLSIKRLVAPVITRIQMDSTTSRSVVQEMTGKCQQSTGYDVRVQKNMSGELDVVAQRKGRLRESRTDGRPAARQKMGRLKQPVKAGRLPQEQRYRECGFVDGFDPPTDRRVELYSVRSANGSRLVVTAGTAEQKAWALKLSADSSYSIFTEALLKSLRDGGADRKNRGFVTIEQALADTQVQLGEITRKLGPGHGMKPQLTPLKASLKGTFVFLNPKAQKPSIPQGDVTFMGLTVAKSGSGNPESGPELELAYWKAIESLHDPGLYALHCKQFPNGTFCPIARRLMELPVAPAAPRGLVALVDGQGPTKEELERDSVDQLQTLMANGNRDAITQLGSAYESGAQGAIQDLPASIAYYTKAADQGDGAAAHRLGAIYYFGRKGVPPNPEDAVKWYQKAVSLGDAAAMFDLGVLYANGKAGLSRDDIKAADLYLKAANGGDANGMVALGGMYLRGAGGLPLDEKKAAGLYQRAFAMDNVPAMVVLGAMYEHGQGGLPMDEHHAVELYQKAADRKDPKGLAYLGLMYEKGKGGLAPDEGKAADLYRQSAVLDGEDGIAFLANMYEPGGGGLPTDQGEAVRLYSRAAQMGNSYAAQQLKRLQADKN